MTLITAQIDMRRLAATAAVVAAANGWRLARRALMRASADGQNWSPELVERLTRAERQLELTLDAVESSLPSVPGDYGPDPDFG